MDHQAHKHEGPIQALAGMTPDKKIMLATAMSVAIAVILVILKFTALSLSHSQSMLASLADSSLDLVASLTTFFVVRFAKTPPDKEHPFGHGKAEAFSALFQAALVFASAALVIQECVHGFMTPKPIAASGFSMVVLVISIVLTLALLFFQNMALKATNSVAVSADRMHYLTDLLSNSVALIGVGAAGFGLIWVDSLAGFVIALWFVWGAIQVLREAADHLMDKALDQTDLDNIKALLTQDGAILGVHQLRTRVAGPYILIQMHAEMRPDLTLIAAHDIIIAAEKRLLAAYPNADIIIHPDPHGHSEPHGGVFGNLDQFETQHPEILDSKNALTEAKA